MAENEVAALYVKSGNACCTARTARISPRMVVYFANAACKAFAMSR